MLSSQASSQGGLESFLQCIASLWTAGSNIDTHYIEHQAALEKAISDGYRKSSKQVNLNLLMPRAQLDKSGLSLASATPSQNQALSTAKNNINSSTQNKLIGIIIIFIILFNLSLIMVRVLLKKNSLNSWENMIKDIKKI